MGRSCEGKVALVTGASQGGTGTTLAVRLAAEGADVGITARSEEGLKECARRIEEVGGKALVLPCDLGDPDGGRADLVARTEEAFGPIDILVNNAVAHDLKQVHEWTIPDLEWYTHVNLWAPWQMSAQVIPGMRERGSGWILNLTSFSGELPPGPPFPYKAMDGSNMYGATKAALNRLTVATAGENYDYGIACNALTPQVAIYTPRSSNSTLIPDKGMFEPVECMAEAGLALVTGDPKVLTGRIAFSVQLLLELQRPMYDATGTELIEGWQPDDLPEIIRGMAELQAARGWPKPFDFGGRVNTPTPDSIKGAGAEASQDFARPVWS
jgi:NAD(P)-dependent dehydrogenase (short-subunit alcohol dehydrogenase family)